MTYLLFLFILGGKLAPIFLHKLGTLLEQGIRWLKEDNCKFAVLESQDSNK